MCVIKHGFQSKININNLTYNLYKIRGEQDTQ